MSIFDTLRPPSFLEMLNRTGPLLDHTVQVTSFGGTATSMMYRFLDDYEVGTPYSKESRPYKHLPAPPSDKEVKEGFRALYLFTNPMNAVLSVFRRGYQEWHARNTTMDEEMLDKDWDLSSFLQKDTDPFQLHNHFRNWTQAKRHYPIMLLKYDALWDRLPEVFAFLGLPSEATENFPDRRERTSDWREASPHIQDGLRSTYGDLKDDIDTHPELQIILSGSTT